MELSWIDQPNIIIVNEKSSFLVCEHRSSLVKRAGIIYRHHKTNHLKFAFALTSAQELDQRLVYSFINYNLKCGLTSQLTIYRGFLYLNVCPNKL